MFNVSACNIPQLPNPSSNDPNQIGLKKNHKRPRKEEGDEPSDSSEDDLLGDRKIHQRCGGLNFPDHKRFIIQKLTSDGQNKSRLGPPLSFMREYGLNKPGEIGLMGKDGRTMIVKLRQDCRGRMSFGKGWTDFVLANGLQIGETFTLELIWKGSTPMLRLFSTTGKIDSECDKSQERNCSQACEDEEPRSGNRGGNDENNIEDIEFSSLENNHRVLTLTLTPEDVGECKLILPSEYMRDNGIEKLVKITILGKAKTMWWGLRPSRDGTIAVGIGWENFCKTNGINIGQLFTLEFINQEEDTTPVFRIRPKSRG